MSWVGPLPIWSPQLGLPMDILRCSLLERPISLSLDWGRSSDPMGGAAQSEHLLRVREVQRHESRVLLSPSQKVDKMIFPNQNDSTGLWHLLDMQLVPVGSLIAYWSSEHCQKQLPGPELGPNTPPSPINKAPPKWLFLISCLSRCQLSSLYSKKSSL